MNNIHSQTVARERELWLWKAKAEARPSVVTTWMEDRYVLGFPAAPPLPPKHFSGVRFCVLSKSPLGETKLLACFTHTCVCVCVCGGGWWWWWWSHTHY